MIDHSVANPGKMGWGEEFQSHANRFGVEQRLFGGLEETRPAFVMNRAARAENPVVAQAVKDAMAADGMTGGFSCRHIEKVVFGDFLKWQAQKIGSCVASGGMRLLARRCLIEAFLLNDPESVFGTTLVGVNNVAPFGPYSYRAGRKKAGINGNGDGSYCSAHVDGAADYGVLPCSTASLVSDAFPEPQVERVYREWGANDTLLNKFAAEGRKLKLLESTKIKSPDQAKTILPKQKKPYMVCSMWAFRPDYQHPTWKLADGSPVIIYKRDTGNQWAHNMSIDAIVIGPDGHWYVVVDNSWGPNAHKNGSYFVIPFELYVTWLPQSEQVSIGEVDMTDNVVVSI